MTPVLFPIDLVRWTRLEELEKGGSSEGRAELSARVEEANDAWFGDKQQRFVLICTAARTFAQALSEVTDDERMNEYKVGAQAQA
jgi:hypothetical protein